MIFFHTRWPETDNGEFQLRQERSLGATDGVIWGELVASRRLCPTLAGASSRRRGFRAGTSRLGRVGRIARLCTPGWDAERPLGCTILAGRSVYAKPGASPGQLHRMYRFLIQGTGGLKSSDGKSQRSVRQ